MTSLRKQLSCWLLPLYCMAAVVTIATTYWVFGRTVDFFMDNQLRVLVDSHVGQTQAPVIQPLTAHNVEKGDLIVQIWDRNDRLLATSWPSLRVSAQGTSGFHDVGTGDQSWRVYTVRTPDRTIQSAQSLWFRHRIIKSQAFQAGLPIVLLIPVSALILWLGMRWSFKRLESVVKAAASQNEHSVVELPVEDVPTEIQPLVLAVNRLLTRLKTAFAAQRRFVQDAAHELRTPVTAVSLQLENLKSHVSGDEATAQVGQLEAGIARTKRLVEQLLRLARQEAPRSDAVSTSIALEELLRDIVGQFMPIADRRRIDLGMNAKAAPHVQANADDLHSLFHNLLDNALRYTPEHGVIDINLYNDAGSAVVEIIDSGPGISEEHLPRVFDRFFRVLGSDADGSGLGLAIARSAAERSRAILALRNRGEGTGLIAYVRFAGQHHPASLPSRETHGRNHQALDAAADATPVAAPIVAD